MDFKLLRIAEVLVVTIGGVLIGFTYGAIDMYNKTMGGLGLIEGGTPSHLDMGTLYRVSELMSDIIPASKANTFGIAGLLIVSIGILTALLVDRSNEGRASTGHRSLE